MVRRFFSGNTLEQAILQAASHYGIDPDQVAYTSREKKHGFVNRRRIVIEVDPEAPQKVKEETNPSPEPSTETAESTGEDRPVEEAGQVDESADESEAAEETETTESEDVDSSDGDASVDEPKTDEPKTDEPETEELKSEESDSAEPEADEEPEHVDESHSKDRSDDGEDREEGLDGDEDDEDEEDEDSEESDGGEWDDADTAYEKSVCLILDFLDLELDYSIEEEEEVFFIEFYGDDCDDLLENDGEVLRAIGHLLPRLVRGFAGDSWPCKVDCNGFQESRIKELEDLAVEVAEQVRSDGEAQLLDPMNPSDRRVVHLALAEDETVETFSEGDGFLKRVKISPVDD